MGLVVAAIVATTVATTAAIVAERPVRRSARATEFVDVERKGELGWDDTRT